MNFQKLALAFALTTAFALAGCASDDDGNGGGNGTTSGTMTSGTGTTGAPTSGATTGPDGEGNLTHISCTAQAGASGNVIAAGNIGGCFMNDGEGVAGASTVMVMTLATGCVSWYDETPGDQQTEGEAEVGTTYADGTTFGVYCDATMAPNSESSMDLQVA